MTGIEAAPATSSDRSVLAAVLVLTAVSFGGAVISVREGLSETWLDAVGPDGHLSVPLPMTALQILAAAASSSTRRPLALVGSGVLALSAAVAVASGLFDGGYADERLGGGARAYQVLLVASLVGVAAVAATRFVRVLRSR